MNLPLFCMVSTPGPSLRCWVVTLHMFLVEVVHALRINNYHEPMGGLFESDRLSSKLWHTGKNIGLQARI